MFILGFWGHISPFDFAEEPPSFAKPTLVLQNRAKNSLTIGLWAAAWNLACPASGRDVYDRAFVRLIALPHVGYDYMNSRLVHDQTLTGYLGGLMGCTQKH